MFRPHLLCHSSPLYSSVVLNIDLLLRQRKEQAENAQQWLESAQARTQAYYANGPRGPTTWVLTEGHKIPQGALVGGEENGCPLYIARAFYKVRRSSPNTFDRSWT